jgi:hypothetical protein
LFNTTPQNPITDAQATYVYNTYGKQGAGTQASDMWNRLGKTQKINPYGQHTSIPSMATPPFNPNSKKFGPGFMHGGELPHAQVGLPPGFDFNDPYGLQQDRFGQTANYADTPGYSKQQQNPNIDYNKLNNFNIGSGINDNASRSYGDPYANDGVNYQIPKQTTMTPVSAYSKGVTPYSKTNQTKTNDKVVRNVSGQQMANNALLGLSIFNASLDDTPKVNQRQNTDKFAYQNSENPYGIHTANVQGGAKYDRPNKYIATQDYGTSGYSTAKTGGQMNFASGGQYKVSHDQLLQLLRDGAEIEFL